MEYRINQRTKDRISAIGIGTACLSDASEKEALEALELAHEAASIILTWQLLQRSASDTAADFLKKSAAA